MPHRAKAIVALEPHTSHEPGAKWELQDVTISRDLEDGELLVRMVASGICHTDFFITSRPAVGDNNSYPRVVGHEGSGYIEAVGPKVSIDVAVGDPVLLSFDHCGECPECKADEGPGFCSKFWERNFFGQRDVFFSADGKGVSGKCFGQSSLASMSIVAQNCVVPVKGLVDGIEDLRVFAPLGCGYRTGAGAIMNLAKPGRKDRVMVLGLGGVGLSAVMAAKICGVSQIVAVDRVASRIELAKSVGATHTVDTSKVEHLVAEFQQITDGRGPSVVIDTTGYLPVLQAGYDSLSKRGTCVLIAGNDDPSTYKLNVDILTALTKASTLIGCGAGNSDPLEIIPRLIQYYREGKFPIDKLSRFYQGESLKNALHDMHSGETVKPIITWT